MVGGGMKSLEDSGRPMSKVLPAKAKWIQDRVAQFVPQEKRLITEQGLDIQYEYLVVALGLQLDYQKVIGQQFRNLEKFRLENVERKKTWFYNWTFFRWQLD